MKKQVIISPFSKKLRNGKNNPKNFPYWKEVIEKLKDKGFNVIQIGVDGEEVLISDEYFNSSLMKIKELVEESVTWISVDNFMNHFGHLLEKKGIVIFGKSDPLIFGYNDNINLLKDRKYLRKHQFAIWEEEEFDPEVFIGPDEVIKSVEKIYQEVI